MHRITDAAVQEEQARYKKEYPPFEEYVLSEEDEKSILFYYRLLVKAQDGMDTDDYRIEDDNNVERYLGKDGAGKSVLFLGTGTGREVLAAKELGFSAYGVTLGSRNVHYGKKYLGLSSCEIIESLCENLPFAPEVFDIVAGFQVFEHAISPMLVLLEQFRILKPHGKLMLEWPAAKRYHLDGNPHHFVCYSPGQAEALFKKAGFENIRLFYQDLTCIPEEKKWSDDHDQYLCIEGTKARPTSWYLTQALARK